MHDIAEAACCRRGICHSSVPAHVTRVFTAAARLDALPERRDAVLGLPLARTAGVNLGTQASRRVFVRLQVVQLQPELLDLVPLVCLQLPQRLQRLWPLLAVTGASRRHPVCANSHDTRAVLP